MLSFKSSLCILDNSPLLDKCFVKIFSQSLACLLILLTVSFAEQKFLILNFNDIQFINFFLSRIMLLVL